jgi:hypothetical protein
LPVQGLIAGFLEIGVQLGIWRETGTGIRATRGSTWAVAPTLLDLTTNLVAFTLEGE